MRRWLVAIFVLGLVLRLWGLTNHPAGFTPDEASFGYDAYSILKTGKDQWGNTLPLSFKSFGDYKLPLYGYLAVPTVFLFGLNEFAVRLPNALLGSFSVIVVYFLVLKIFKKDNLALFAALILAISPWHIALSRGAFEANLTTFLMPFAIWMFYKGLTDRKYLLVSFITFGLNLFSYHSARLVTPLIVFYLIFAYLPTLKRRENILATVVIMGALLVAGVNLLFGGGARASSVAIFNSQANWSAVADNRFGAVQVGLPDILARGFNNKVTFTLGRFVGNYLSYFSPQFLLSEGAREGTYGMVPGIGVIYFVEGALIVGLILYLVKEKMIKEKFIFIFWLLMAPIPAALSIGPGHAANRAAIMMPALQILLAVGGIYLYEKYLKDKRWVYIYGSLLIIFFAFFIEDYFYQQPARQAKAMIYGTRGVFTKLLEIQDNYSQITISKGISEAHIFLAFYGKVDPKIYQEEVKTWNFDSYGLTWVDQMGEYALGKYLFRSMDYMNLSQKEEILLVGKPDEFLENVKPLKVIYYPNKVPAYLIVDPTSQAFAFKY